jgi:hypothetical protein
MRTIEREQPDPPERDDRRAQHQGQHEDEQAERCAAEEQRQVELAADDPSGAHGARVVHAPMIIIFRRRCFGMAARWTKGRFSQTDSS